ncbi:hypothetical protein [Tenacibaculum mesophilum]|uniref:hypothetical protein n=1 Tax=Tenacibaculum mesophilum TaxID=104268 RepID=UPI003747E4D7
MRGEYKPYLFIKYLLKLFPFILVYLESISKATSIPVISNSPDTFVSTTVNDLPIEP